MLLITISDISLKYFVNIIPGNGLLLIFKICKNILYQYTSYLFD